MQHLQSPLVEFEIHLFQVLLFPNGLFHSANTFSEDMVTFPLDPEHIVELINLIVRRYPVQIHLQNPSVYDCLRYLPISNSARPRDIATSSHTWLTGAVSAAAKCKHKVPAMFPFRSLIVTAMALLG